MALSSITKVIQKGSVIHCKCKPYVWQAGAEIDGFLERAETSNWPINWGEIWSISMSETDSLVWSLVSLPDFLSSSSLPSSELSPMLSGTCLSNTWAEMVVVWGRQAWVAKGQSTVAELPDSDVKAAEALFTWGGLCLIVDQWALGCTGWESVGLSGRLLVKEGLGSLDEGFDDIYNQIYCAWGLHPMIHITTYLHVVRERCGSEMVWKPLWTLHKCECPHPPAHLRHQSTEWASFPPILHLISSYTHVSIVWLLSYRASVLSNKNQRMGREFVSNPREAKRRESGE